MQWSRIKLLVMWSVMTTAFILSSVAAYADGYDWT
jgi:hypothetical protein